MTSFQPLSVLRCLLLCGAALGLAGTTLAQTPTAADSASADAAWLGAADAARTYGAGPNGSLDPSVPTIHKFADFACPTCQRVYDARSDSIKTAFVETGRANYVVRAFPLPRLLRGPHASEAAFCAGALGGQDAFNTFERRLYATQSDWRYLRDPLPVFRQESAAAGLDQERFEECLARDATSPLMALDLRLGASLGASGTPTFVFVAPGASEGADLFYGEEPLSRFEEALDVASTPVLNE
ncbi:MAG: thioredoxin domain-containing protein [Bacteroidota bacterium]